MSLKPSISAWKSGTITPPSLLVFEAWDRLDRGWLVERILEQFDMRLVSVHSEYGYEGPLGA
jgi:hypothetical protein